jgi:hypothetical protein
VHLHPLQQLLLQLLLMLWLLRLLPELQVGLKLRQSVRALAKGHTTKDILANADYMLQLATVCAEGTPPKLKDTQLNADYELQLSTVCTGVWVGRQSAWHNAKWLDW